MIDKALDIFQRPFFSIAHVVLTIGVLIGVVWNIADRNAKLEQISEQIPAVGLIDRRLLTLESTIQVRSVSDQEWRTEMRQRLDRIELAVQTNSRRLNNQ